MVLHGRAGCREMGALGGVRAGRLARVRGSRGAARLEQRERQGELRRRGKRQGRRLEGEGAPTPKAAKRECAVRAAGRASAAAEGTAAGPPPSLGGGRAGLAPGPVEKPFCVPWSSATRLVFCSGCRKEPKSLLRCTTPGPSARVGAAGGTTWWVPLAQTPRLLPSRRPGRATATETRATSGPLAPRVRCQPGATPVPSAGSGEGRWDLTAGLCWAASASRSGLWRWAVANKPDLTDTGDAGPGPCCREIRCPLPGRSNVVRQSPEPSAPRSSPGCAEEGAAGRAALAWALVPAVAGERWPGSGGRGAAEAGGLLRGAARGERSSRGRRAPSCSCRVEGRGGGRHGVSSCGRRAPSVWVLSRAGEGRAAASSPGVSSAAARVGGLHPGPATARWLRRCLAARDPAPPSQLVLELGRGAGHCRGTAALGSGDGEGAFSRAVFGLTSAFPPRGKLALPDPHQAEAEPGLVAALCGGDATGAR